VIVKEAARVLRPGGTMVFDHCSSGNYALAARAGELNYTKFGYDPREGGDQGVFYAATSADELRGVAEAAGLDLLEVTPLGFFRQNAVIASALGPEGFVAYKKAIDTFYKDPGARAFIQWFEHTVTRALPLEMVNGIGAVLQKRPVS